MRIEAGVHPAAMKIDAVYLDGVKQRFAIWIDTDTGEMCRYITENGELPRGGIPIEAEIVRGAITFDIADEHRHLLEWKP